MIRKAKKKTQNTWECKFNCSWHFNVVQDTKLDYFKYKAINNKKAHEKTLDIKVNSSLVDPFREAYPPIKRYTWRKKSPLRQARLEYFHISENFAIFSI